MESMIELAVGRLEVDWGRNGIYRDHSALFQAEADFGPVPHYYFDDDQGGVAVDYKDGLTKPFAKVLDRLELLGHTRDASEREFDAVAESHGVDTARFDYERLGTALARVDVNSVSADYAENRLGRFFRREVAPRLQLEPPVDRNGYDVSEALEALSPYAVLQLLADNPSVSGLPVQWAFGDVVESGHAEPGQFLRPLDPAHRFLIVTEGSSDANILRQAFKMLRPHVADFFDFVDMGAGYPFSGTGNMYRFVQGLVGISVQNKVVVVFDNDAAGGAVCQRCSHLSVLPNMRIVKLPDMPGFRGFPTVGPQGEHSADINGRAAAIECYLDIGSNARVRWTSYDASTGLYQGALEGKERYARAFLTQRNRTTGYDYSKIDAVLACIVESAIAIAEQTGHHGLPFG